MAWFFGSESTRESRVKQNQQSTQPGTTCGKKLSVITQLKSIFEQNNISCVMYVGWQSITEKQSKVTTHQSEENTIKIATLDFGIWLCLKVRLICHRLSSLQCLFRDENQPHKKKRRKRRFRRIRWQTARGATLFKKFGVFLFVL